MGSLPPVHVCGRPVGEARHVCVFVSSKDEHYEIMAPYVRDGVASGERVLQIIDQAAWCDQEARLTRAGVPMREAAERGQLEAMGWSDVYLKDGYFEPERMMDVLEAAALDRRAEGFPRMRAMGDMEWALKGAPGSERLLEYETRVNSIIGSTPRTRTAGSVIS